MTGESFAARTHVAPLVDITDVVVGATRIRGRDLQIGDTVFDVFGGEHTIWKVVRFKSGVRFYKGRYGEWIDNDDTITIGPRAGNGA